MRERERERQIYIERERERDRERERERDREREKEREREERGERGKRKKGREKERQRKTKTNQKKGEAKLGASSTSLPGGHQVDGVPPVLSSETDQTARPLTKRVSVKYENSFQFLMMIQLNTLANIVVSLLSCFAKLLRYRLKPGIERLNSVFYSGENFTI